MATAGDLLENLSAMDLVSIARETLSENADTMASLNEQQMFAGIRADGSEILPSYADLTIEIKKQKGQPYDRVTLRDEGDFYAGLYADVQGDSIEYGSTDEKSAELEEKYSKARGSIFGLTVGSKSELVEYYLQPSWESKVTEETGLPFE